MDTAVSTGISTNQGDSRFITSLGPLPSHTTFEHGSGCLSIWGGSCSGTERPIAYASRTLTPSEKNYSQLEKEALALIFGVTPFYQYLHGQHFTLIPDHKPLTTILGPHNSIPTLAAAPTAEVGNYLVSIQI